MLSARVVHWECSGSGKQTSIPQGKQRAAADIPAMNESMPEKFKRGPVSREASASGVCGSESGVVRGGDFEMGYSQSKPAHPPHALAPRPSPPAPRPTGLADESSGTVSYTL